MKKTGKLLVFTGLAMMLLGLVFVGSVVYAQLKPLAIFYGNLGYSADFQPTSADLSSEIPQVTFSYVLSTEGNPDVFMVATSWFIDGHSVHSAYGSDGASFTVTGSDYSVGQHTISAIINLQNIQGNEDLIDCEGTFNIAPSTTPTPTSSNSPTPLPTSTHNPFPTPQPTNPISIIVPENPTEKYLLTTLGTILIAFGSIILVLALKKFS